MPDSVDVPNQLSLVEPRSATAPMDTKERPPSYDYPNPAAIPDDSGDASMPSGKADRLEFFLPVSGFVWLYPEERAIVDHPAFQRLARIYQLGQSYFVYRGATHKRIEHVLGAVHVAQRMISAVRMNAEKLRRDRSIFFAPPLTPYEERFVRLGALLHDIGHLAAGHTVEDELGLVSKHDADDRLDIIFENSLRMDWLLDSRKRTLGSLIDEQYSSTLAQSRLSQNLTSSTLVRLLIRKEPEQSNPDPHADRKREILASNKFRLSSCRDMIGNTICADLLDYIYRDWYHVGKPRPFDDRLLQYMELRRSSKAMRERKQELAFRSDVDAEDQFVIFLGKPPKIRSDAVSHILELLEWRYSLAETVLFHRTKLAAAAMLDRALYELWGETQDESDVIRFFLPLSDEEMLTKCREYAEGKIKTTKKKEELEGYRTASDLLTALTNRGLHKQLLTLLRSDLPVGQVEKIKQEFSPISTKGVNSKERQKSGAKQRNFVLRLLEKDFELARGSLTMYCPAKMNRKIAEVKIAVGEEIQRLCDFESQDSHNSELTGGHLDAQLIRFDRLWRVHFFIDSAEQERIGLERLALLRMAIEKLALGKLSHDETYDSVATMIARSLISIENSPWKDHKIQAADTAAKNAPSSGHGRYPFGASSIQSFLSK